MEVDQNIISDNYFSRSIRNSIFTEALHRTNHAYVAHGIVRCTVPYIPLSFMKRFMAEVAAKGRLSEIAEPRDKEGPRVLEKNFNDNKSWFFATFGVVAYLACFAELNAIIGEDEVAFGPLRHPNKTEAALYSSPLARLPRN